MSSSGVLIWLCLYERAPTRQSLHARTYVCRTCYYYSSLCGTVCDVMLESVDANGVADCRGLGLARVDGEVKQVQGWLERVCALWDPRGAVCAGPGGGGRDVPVCITGVGFEHVTK